MPGALTLVFESVTLQCWKGFIEEFPDIELQGATIREVREKVETVLYLLHDGVPELAGKQIQCTKIIFPRLVPQLLRS